MTVTSLVAAVAPRTQAKSLKTWERRKFSTKWHIRIYTNKTDFSERGLALRGLLRAVILQVKRLLVSRTRLI